MQISRNIVKDNDLIENYKRMGHLVFYFPLCKILAKCLNSQPFYFVVWLVLCTNINISASLGDVHV